MSWAGGSLGLPGPGVQKGYPLLVPTPRNFCRALCSGLLRLRRGVLGERDSQPAGTHPSSGRVDSVRSFHSAQKASRRSRSSSDTWQLSSVVAMIVLTPSLPLGSAPPRPFKYPPPPPPPGAIFSPSGVRCYKQSQGSLMGDSGSRVGGWGTWTPAAAWGQRSASKEIKMLQWGQRSSE